MSGEKDEGDTVLPCVLITSCDPGFKEEELVSRKYAKSNEASSPAWWLASITDLGL